MELYTARWLLPVCSPPVSDGAVLVEHGRIVAVGRRLDLLREHARDGVDLVELGERVVMPGAVNAHTHVELSWMADDPPPAPDYAGWVAGLLERRRTEDPERARRAARDAVAAMAAHGTIAIGDIANGDAATEALAQAPFGGVAFHEVYGFAAAAADALAARALDESTGVGRRLADERWTASATPHAPHTCSEPLLRGLADAARRLGRPLSIHAAESGEECRLLRDGDGPIAELLAAGGLWDDGWRPPGVSPVALLARVGALGPRTLVVHAVRIDDDDIELLRRSGATVVTCPRSNETLGVGVAPVPRLIAAGVPVALGTDSLSSTPDLDPFAELRALARTHPSLEPDQLVRIATANGAAALGLGKRFGAIAADFDAALVTVPAEGARDPWEAILGSPERITPIRELQR